MAWYSYPRLRSILRTGWIAVAATAGATVIRVLFAPILGYHIPFVTFPLAVLVAGYFGGLWAGLLATALCLVAAFYFFIEPAYALNRPSLEDIVGLSIFAVVGVCASLICEALRRARRRAEQSADALRASEEAVRQTHDDLEQRIEMRTIDLSRANESSQAEIAERRQTEEALRESEANLKAAQRIARVGSWQWDIVANTAFWSDETYSMFGLAPGWLSRHRETFLDMIHPDDKDRVAQALQDAVAGGREYDLEYRILLADNTEKTIHARAEVVRDPHGKPLLMRGTVHDITERKRDEEALRVANEALAEADRRKNEFLAMLAHELRNPLAPVRTAVQVLRIAGPLDPIFVRQRDIIDRQINHMARLVDDLLDVSRITRGRVELKKHPLHLADVMVHAVELATPLFETRRQKFSVSLPPDDVCVEADPDRLAQALGNLLSNAAKFTGEEGQIWLGASRDGDQAVIRVRDSGVGIAPEILSHVFELFAQANQGLARSQGGLGIGLTMVKQLVEMHGGTVKAYSEGPDKGSEFVIRLPAMPEQERGIAWSIRPGAAIPSAAPRRILVVDDVADTANSLAEMLALEGHETRAAYDGPTALKMLSEFMPNVVLMDIGMPVMDGYEAARRMRLHEAGKNVLIVALTGYAQEDDREMARHAGFNRHLAKPVNLEELREILSRPLLAA